MALESSRSSSAADSYIGSLISLTSKSEIRYEGVLSNINTEESSIGLHNVRSFGTEGRKKDGPQVMPSDKVYEYILFRGSDIKDLQVKSSPPVQPAQPINSDPAIIQSHYPIPPHVISTPSTLPLSGSGSLSEIGPHSSQLGHPGSTFQSGLPLYPGGSIGSWGPSPQNPNNSGLAMPMYWPGYYGPTNGLPLQQQQSLLRPPGGISMPPSMQPQSYPAFNPSPMLTTTSSSTSLPASNFPSNLPPVPPMMMLASEPLPSFNKPVVPPSATLSANLSNLDLNAVVPSSSRPSLISAPPLSFSHPVSTMTSSLVVQTETEAPRPPPPLVTPGQLLPQSGSQVALSQPATQTQTAHKDVEVIQVSPTPSPAPELQAPVVTEAQPPILPLPSGPSPSRTVHKPNGAHYQARHNYRGRERGRGSGQSSRPTMKFTEEFDFTAMNEKFNKDEVWGHLGRSNSKSGSKEKVGDGNGSDEYEYEDEDEEDVQVPKIEVKPVYSKDDFFDTLSCNSLDNQSNNGGRTRFSEQRKIDTETFGEFSRYRGGWGGRGRGGRSRGGGYGYGGGGRGYGYGYGYGGRGRGGGRNNIASRDF